MKFYLWQECLYFLYTTTLNTHMARMSKNLNTTWSWTAKLINQMQNNGLVRRNELKGRTKTISLTEKGKEAAEGIAKTKGAIR